jgi:hypothetical protein
VVQLSSGGGLGSSRLLINFRMSVEIYNGRSKSPLLLLAAGGNSGMESAVAMAFGEGEGRRCLRWRRGK